MATLDEYNAIADAQLEFSLPIKTETRGRWQINCFNKATREWEPYFFDGTFNHAMANRARRIAHRALYSMKQAHPVREVPSGPAIEMLRWMLVEHHLRRVQHVPTEDEIALAKQATCFIAVQPSSFGLSHVKTKTAYNYADAVTEAIKMKAKTRFHLMPSVYASIDGGLTVLMSERLHNMAF